MSSKRRQINFRPADEEYEAMKAAQELSGRESLAGWAYEVCLRAARLAPLEDRKTVTAPETGPTPLVTAPEISEVGDQRRRRAATVPSSEDEGERRGSATASISDGGEMRMPKLGSVTRCVCSRGTADVTAYGVCRSCGRVR